MSTYLTFFNYTKHAWHEMVERPEDREAATRKVLEANGAKLLAFFWMFGDHDGLVIYEAPDPIVAGTVLVAIISTGRIESLKTNALLTGVEAEQVLDLAKVASAAYAPPGGATNWHAEYGLEG